MTISVSPLKRLNRSFVLDTPSARARSVSLDLLTLCSGSWRNSGTFSSSRFVQLGQHFRDPAASIIHLARLAGNTNPAHWHIASPERRRRWTTGIDRIPDRAPIAANFSPLSLPQAAEPENRGPHHPRKRQRAGNDDQQHLDRAGLAFRRRVRCGGWRRGNG